MAGNGSKKEKRRAKKAEKKAAAEKKSYSFTSSNSSVTISISDGSSDYNPETVKYVPAEELYSSINDSMNQVPVMGKLMDGIFRNFIVSGTIPAFTRRLTALPCVLAKNLAWVQLLLVDEQKAAQLKLYAVGARMGCNEDDSNVVERSRKMFKDAAPSFMDDFGLWIFSRSL
ncbi:hypothetical protein KSS87_021259, partial [Heliosperma pusillum]